MEMKIGAEAGAAVSIGERLPDPGAPHGSAPLSEAEKNAEAHNLKDFPGKYPDQCI